MNYYFCPKKNLKRKIKPIKDENQSYLKITFCNKFFQFMLNIYLLHSSIIHPSLSIFLISSLNKIQFSRDYLFMLFFC